MCTESMAKSARLQLAAEIKRKCTQLTSIKLSINELTLCFLKILNSVPLQYLLQSWLSVNGTASYIIKCFEIWEPHSAVTSIMDIPNISLWANYQKHNYVLKLAVNAAVSGAAMCRMKLTKDQCGRNSICATQSADEVTVATTRGVGVGVPCSYEWDGCECCQFFVSTYLKNS